MSPSDLQQDLADAGELGFGGDGYIFPDNHKWGHFMRGDEERGGLNPSASRRPASYGVSNHATDNFSSMPEYYWPYNHTGMFR
jgi:hypothetical protein